jgi:hypothetical protein
MLDGLKVDPGRRGAHTLHTASARKCRRKSIYSPNFERDGSEKLKFGDLKRVYVEPAPQLSGFELPAMVAIFLRCAVATVSYFHTAIMIIILFVIKVKN